MADLNPKMRKPSRGRQKIEMKKIEQTSNRQVAFSKRRSGIFKKAGELAVLCGAEVAVIALSERERPFSFGHPSADVVINRFLSGNNNNNNHHKKTCPNNNNNASLYPFFREQNEQYEVAVKELEEEKKKGEMKVEKVGENGSMFLWDLPIENMGLEELEDYKESLLELRHNVVTRFNEVVLLDHHPTNFYSSNAPPPPLSFANNNNPPMVASMPDFGGNNHAGFDNHNLVNKNEGCSSSTVTTSFAPHLQQQPRPPLHGFFKFD